MKLMKAVAYKNAGAIEREDALEDIVLEKPKASGFDLLVKIQAVSVNPVDTKIRRRVQPAGWRILGYDAAGIVEAVGEQVENFKPGDAVFYAGELERQGTNSEYHLVDARLVGRKPKNLSAAEAAALPLTAITAWEMLFERLQVQKAPVQGGKLLLLIGGAGGVGSISIQLLRAITDLTVIATASRPETKNWVRDCGAHYVLDHSQALAPQVAALGLGAPGLVFSTTKTDTHYADIVELMAPQGRLGLIDDPGDLSIMPLKRKSLSLHWELMFTRSLFKTPDLAEQGKLLNKLKDLIESQQVRSTLSEIGGRITAPVLRQVHARLETGLVQGKIVLEGF